MEPAPHQRLIRLASSLIPPSFSSSQIQKTIGSETSQIRNHRLPQTIKIITGTSRIPSAISSIAPVVPAGAKICKLFFGAGVQTYD